MNHQPSHSYYQKTLSTKQHKAIKAKRVSRWVGTTRLLLFLAICYTFYLFTNGLSFLYILLPLIPFAVLHIYDLKHQRYRNKLSILIKILEAEIASLEGDISKFRDGKEYIDSKHNYSYDLEIFGQKSLFQLINRTATKEGADHLASLLQDTDRSAEEVRENQKATKELSSKITWRQNILAEGWNTPLHITPLKEAASDYKKIITSKGQIVIAILLTLFNITAIVTASLGILSPSIAIITVLLLIASAGALAKKINKQQLLLDTTISSMRGLEQLLQLVYQESSTFQDTKLKRLAKSLCGEDDSFISEIKELNSIISALDQRANLVVAVLLNGLYFRDFWVVLRTDRWFIKNQNNVSRWLEHIAELDALCSLSHISYHYNTTTYPEVSQEKVYDAEEVVHPLIPKDEVVGNNIEIQQQHTIHIVTGANMAGKSTYLRTVGINLILASTGSTVFAKKMQFRPTALFSSMRNTDQLTEGISFFHAELIRLKQMRTHLESHQNSFILLDEILKGTNSEDKLKGSRIVLEKILDYPCSGIVATHDLELKHLEEEKPEHFHNYCFEFTYEEEEILFDYRLREGATQKMNASYLLKKIFLES
ncbi:hypothetical protein K4L44_10380 [Halosquirtibacter laminarini]|uniref:Uncharacterized protein n=1 Tax=Halosquirtibacter laminarini TaxID=3374600 RepID=A0AC61NM35_9BACT|nr:hypothetical protein K4L44_10380 [Prolixibacteraceae bacterium]